MELHNLRNGVSLCVCVFLFLWRSPIHLNTIKNVHSNKRADENCGSIPVPDPSDFHQTLPVNPTLPPPSAFFWLSPTGDGPWCQSNSLLGKCDKKLQRAGKSFSSCKLYCQGWGRAEKYLNANFTHFVLS